MKNGSNDLKSKTMIRSYIPLLLTFLAFTAGNIRQASAQRDTTKMNQEVEVIKAYRPSVAKAEKISQMPEIDDTTRFTPEFNYQVNSRPVTTGFTASPISAANIKGQLKEDPGYGMIKLGVGTYSTPYGEFFFNNPKSKSTTFGIHFKHLSSQGTTELTGGEEVDAPFSHNLAEIFGSYIFPGATLSAKLSYNRDMVRFYGYPDTIPYDVIDRGYASFFDQKQRFQKGTLNVALKSEERSENAMKYHAGFNFQYFDALTNQKEKSGGLFVNLDYDFGNFRGIVEASFDHFSTDSIREFAWDNQLTSRQRSLLELKPAVLFQGENWKAQGGLNFYSLFEKDGDNTAKMYPIIDLAFTPVENIMTIYAGLDGFMQHNTLSAIAEENPWADPRLDIRHTDYQYIVSGGLKGKIADPVVYNFGAKYTKANSQYFYIVNTFNPNVINLTSGDMTGQYFDNAFDVEYDNIGILDLSGELSYSKGDQLFILLSGHLFEYSPENLKAASHLPAFTLSATSKYRITDKLSAFTDVHLIGKREVLFKYFIPSVMSIAPPQPFVVTLDPVININLGADYELVKKVKLFGKVDNLLNQSYDHWMGYTSQGLRIMLGASYTF